MIAVDRSDAAPLDLTDEQAVPQLPDAVHAAGARDEELDTLAAENSTLRSHLQRMLAILDQPTTDPVRMARIEQRLAQAEETIEDLVAIILHARSQGSGG